MMDSIEALNNELERLHNLADGSVVGKWVSDEIIRITNILIELARENNKAAIVLKRHRPGRWDM